MTETMDAKDSTAEGAPAEANGTATPDPAPSMAPKPAGSPNTSGSPNPAGLPKRLDAAGRVALARLREAAPRMGRPTLAAMLVAGTLGLGVATDRILLRPDGGGDGVAAGLRQSQDEIGRLRTELHGLKASIDGVKTARTELAAKQTQLTERVERGTQDTGARLGRLGEQLDRIEKTQRDPNRLAALTERLDRMEKQGASVQAAAAPPAPPPRTAAIAAPAVPAAEPATTGSLPDAKTAPADPRKTPLDGYVLRDVDDGVALVESRSGRLFEVSPGMTLPGIGRVGAIERRGRHWVVLTPKGFIAER